MKKRVAFAAHVVATSSETVNVEEVEWENNNGFQSQPFSQGSSQLSMQDNSPSILRSGCIKSSLATSQKKSCEQKRAINPNGKKHALSAIYNTTSSILPENQLTVTVSKRDTQYRTQQSLITESPVSCGTLMSNATDNSLTCDRSADGTPLSNCDPLKGIGQQGGRIHVEGGGGLKVTEGVAEDSSGSRSMVGDSESFIALPSPLTIMSIEVHVQCRTGRAGAHDSREIAMRPDSSRDAIFAVCYVYGLDPGGGEAVETLERGCVFVPVGADLLGRNVRLLPLDKTPGMASYTTMETAKDERQLLLRIASIVQWKDPDALMSWDTQGGGVGYLIERGAALRRKSSDVENYETMGRSVRRPIDMVRLLGRTPRLSPLYSTRDGTTSSKLPPLPPGSTRQANKENELKGDEGATTLGDVKNKTAKDWNGSGLGVEWDERVGAGAAASSVVSHFLSPFSSFLFLLPC